MDRLKNLIAREPLLLLSKSYCGYCRRAKQTLALYPETKSMMVVELDQDPDGDALQSAALQLTKQSTVPNLFVGGRSLGGNDRIQLLHSRGELAGLLRAALGPQSEL